MSVNSQVQAAIVLLGLSWNDFKDYVDSRQCSSDAVRRIFEVLSIDGSKMNTLVSGRVERATDYLKVKISDYGLKKDEAVIQDDLYRWGCPACGYRSGTMPIRCGGVAQWRCGDCYKYSTAVANEHKPGDTMENTLRSKEQLKIVEHPRQGTPARGRPDEQPDSGGEYFRCRGIGTDITPGCFICGGEKGYHANISGFVHHVEAGDRVVRLLGMGTWMDFRPNEPDRIQVKIGACDAHKKNLERLYESVVIDGIITWQKVIAAREPT